MNASINLLHFQKELNYSLEKKNTKSYLRNHSLERKKTTTHTHTFNSQSNFRLATLVVGTTANCSDVSSCTVEENSTFFHAAVETLSSQFSFALGRMRKFFSTKSTVFASRPSRVS